MNGCVFHFSAAAASHASVARSLLPQRFYSPHYYYAILTAPSLREGGEAHLALLRVACLFSALTDGCTDQGRRQRPVACLGIMRVSLSTAARRRGRDELVSVVTGTSCLQQARGAIARHTSREAPAVRRRCFACFGSYYMDCSSHAAHRLQCL